MYPLKLTICYLKTLIKIVLILLEIQLNIIEKVWDRIGFNKAILGIISVKA